MFFKNHKAALDYRKRIGSPKVLKPLVLMTLTSITVILIAIVIAPDNDYGHYFSEDHRSLSESGFVTYLSAMFLAAASVLAGLSFSRLRSRKDWYKYFWLLATLGFGFFFVDELFWLHERTGWWISESTAVPDGYRNWNDIIVIFYGLAALLIMAGFLPEILRFPWVIETLSIAFFFYFIHTLIDSTQYLPYPISTILEESAKVFCNELLALSMLTAFLGIKNSSQS